tara:strand:- start:640 stop:1092 length:453 start_codon:yes stop_codon:yes gene_type:complete
MNIYKFITSVGDMTKSNLFQKIIFLLTNLIYFIPIILYGVNKITIAITIIGIISIIYHLFQCKCSNNNTSKNLLLLDSIVGIIISIYIIYNLYDKLEIWWYILLLISLGIYAIGTSDKGLILYLFLHSLWHIFSGLLFLYAAYIYNKNKK